VPVAWSRVGAPRQGWTNLLVLTGYSVAAFLYLGLRLLVEPGHHYLGFGPDPKAFIWCFGWWPHAILHAENPFVTRAIWAPDGVNLIWTTSIPGLSLLFAPLTLLVGPVVSYNVAAVLLPAFAAWAGFLLCRHLTRALWPGLLGGYLFGFSSYVFGQDEGHPHMTAVFLVPLVALVVVRYIEGDLDGRALALRLGPLLGLEFLISTEVTFTLALAIVLATLLGVALLPARRRRLVGLLGPLAAACVFAALLTAPFVYYALTGFRSSAFHPPGDYVTDLLNFVVPSKLALASLGWASSISDRFPGNGAERGGYLGLPLILIVALFAWGRVRTPSGRFLLAALLFALVGTLGARLSIDGHRSVWLPWAIVGDLPLFDNVLPERIAMYVSFVTAIMAALWTAARPPGVVRWLVPGLAILALLPNPDAGVWASRYAVPAFFTDSAYRGCLAPGGIVLPLPVSAQSESMLWQAESGYRFRMAGGNIAPRPPQVFLAPRGIAHIAEGGALPPSRWRDIATYIRVEHVTSILVDPRLASRWAGALAHLAPPKRLGGVDVYRLSTAALACPQA
jgi:hypothetical protein